MIDRDGLYEYRQSHTLAECAIEFGITGERVRQICAQIQTLNLLREAAAQCRQKPSEEIPIVALLLSVRSYNGVHRLGCQTLADVAKLTEHDVLMTKQMGTRSLAELKGVLDSFGLKFAQVCPRCHRPLEASNG